MTDHPGPKKVCQQASPPPDGRRAKQVVKVPPGGRKLSFWVLSHKVYGINTHWYSGRSVLCLDPDGDCPWDHASHRSYWQGWLSVQTRDTRKLLFLCLSPGARASCQGLQQQKKSLRGLEIIIWRNSNNPRGEMMAALQHVLATPAILQQPPDVAAWLERFYQLEAGQLERDQVAETVDLEALERELPSRPAKGGGK